MHQRASLSPFAQAVCPEPAAASAHAALAKLSLDVALSIERYAIIFGVLLPASVEGTPTDSLVTVSQFEVSPPQAALSTGAAVADMIL